MPSPRDTLVIASAAAAVTFFRFILRMLSNSKLRKLAQECFTNWKVFPRGMQLNTDHIPALARKKQLQCYRSFNKSEEELLRECRGWGRLGWTPDRLGLLLHYKITVKPPLLLSTKNISLFNKIYSIDNGQLRSKVCKERKSYNLKEERWLSINWVLKRSSRLQAHKLKIPNTLKTQNIKITHRYI